MQRVFPKGVKDYAARQASRAGKWSDHGPRCRMWSRRRCPGLCRSGESGGVPFRQSSLVFIVEGSRVPVSQAAGAAPIDVSNRQCRRTTMLEGRDVN